MNNLVEDVYKLTSNILEKRKRYNLMTEDSYYRYILLLNKLYSFLTKYEYSSEDELLLKVIDWNLSSTQSIANAVKKVFIDSLFVVSLKK